MVNDLIARYDSFSASAVSERVASVGERTVRRYLAAMVEEGKLVFTPRGRSRKGMGRDDARAEGFFGLLKQRFRLGGISRVLGWLISGEYGLAQSHAV